MAVNIDKEKLIKHHFWILTGVYVILALIPLVLLSSSVGGTVVKEKDELEKSKTMVKNITNPKNEKYVEAYKKQDEFVAAKKNKVWETAWKTQADMMTWPPEIQEKFSKKYPYFGDPIDKYDDDEWGKAYEDQLKEVFEVAQPLISKDQGVVQFKGDWNAVVGLFRKIELTPPTREDVWLAQEDVWIKRELLRIIRDANDSVARFQEVQPPAAKPGPDGKPAKPAPADPNHKVFRSPVWQIDLTLLRNNKGKYSVRGTLTNISHKRQPASVVFKILTQSNTAESAFATLPVDRDTLAAGASTEIKETPLSDTVAVAGLMGVEEVLTWRTAAVKRVDQISLDHPSARTVNRTLKKPRWAPNTPEGEAAQPQANTGLGGQRQAGMERAAAASSSSTSKNGFVLERYTDTNEQVRHMPVDLVVIVEEERIPEFLAAFDNSRLRIQTLQYHWHHIREKIKPEFGESGTAVVSGSAGTRTGTGGKATVGEGMVGAGGSNRPQIGGAGGGGYGRMMREMMGGRGGGMPGMGGSGMVMGGGTGLGGKTGGGDEEEAEMNLVELAVYGIASIYERYPPKAAPGEEIANK